MTLTRREQLLDKCRHFNGIQNACCNAGVAYDEVRLHHEPIDRATRSLPCIDTFNHGGATCPKHERYTTAEADAKIAESARRLDCFRRGVSPCCDVAIDETHVLTSGRHKGHGPRFCSKCKRLLFQV